MEHTISTQNSTSERTALSLTSESTMVSVNVKHAGVVVQADAGRSTGVERGPAGNMLHDPDEEELEPVQPHDPRDAQYLAPM